jgi:hypothetical protein
MHDRGKMRSSRQAKWCRSIGVWRDRSEPGYEDSSDEDDDGLPLRGVSPCNCSDPEDDHRESQEGFKNFRPKTMKAVTRENRKDAAARGVDRRARAGVERPARGGSDGAAKRPRQSGSQEGDA